MGIPFPHPQPTLKLGGLRNPPVLLSVIVAILVMLPLGLLLLEIVASPVAVESAIWSVALPRMIGNTLLLAGAVAVGTLILGTGLAFLVTSYEFPGRAFLDRALALPLAIPTFVMGFIYMGLLDYAGPLQTALRGVFGSTFQWEVRTVWGAAGVLSLGLYPYVYLTARAAFREHAISSYDAARCCGANRIEFFWWVMLPLARPSLVAGAALAVMEAMTDFGTVRFFSVQTISEGVVRVWEGGLDRRGALQLAILLLIFALGLILLERVLRGRHDYQQELESGRHPARTPLHGFSRWGAFGIGAGVFGAAFVLPIGQLGIWAWEALNTGRSGWQHVFLGYMGTTISLAGIALVIILPIALILAVGRRLRRRGWVRVVIRLAMSGYALPGTVIALTVLLALTSLNQFLSGILPGLLLSGTLGGLLYAYAVRFLAVTFNPIAASFDKVDPALEESARVFGAGSWDILRLIHLPLIGHGVIAGCLLTFVDLMKELPTTLFLRPFGVDTLAVWTYMAASESQWQEAAIPALTIVGVGLIPVLFLLGLGKQERL
jgi:iron(III) transport system permease protein